MSIICSECVSVALVIQHPKRIRSLILTCDLSGSSMCFYSTLSHKNTILGEKFMKHKMCVLILSTIFVRKISHSKNNSAIYDQKCIGIRV
jgi:hypothetical protein